MEHRNLNDKENEKKEAGIGQEKVVQDYEKTTKGDGADATEKVLLCYFYSAFFKLYASWLCLL